MTLLSITGFTAAMFLLAITPGPGVFATVSKAISSGFKKTMPVIAGIVAGDLVFLLFALFGLSVIAEICNVLFLVIRYLGSAYLIWFGIRLWRSAADTVNHDDTARHSGGYGFLGGLSLTLGNPKVIIFYLSFLPNFVQLDQLSRQDMGIIMLIVSLVLGSVMLMYAYAASHATKLFKSTSAKKNVQRAAGSVMIGTGALIISNH